MMIEMSFKEILNIFCDFSLERDGPTDRPTNRPTDGQSLLQGCYGAPKKQEKMKMKAIEVSIDIICILQFYDDCLSVTQLIWNNVNLS